MADFFADESGLVVPSPVVDSLTALVAAKSPFINSGAAVVQFEDAAGMGGHFISKQYNGEDGDHNTRITGAALEPSYLFAVSDVAPVCRRARQLSQPLRDRAQYCARRRRRGHLQPRGQGHGRVARRLHVELRSRSADSHDGDASGKVLEVDDVTSTFSGL